MKLQAKRTQTCLAVALLSVTLTAAAQETGTANGEWPSYGGNLSHDRYSPLDQITAENFSELELAWRFDTDNLGPRPETTFQSTPLMVNGILYSTAGSRREQHDHHRRGASTRRLAAVTHERQGLRSRLRRPDRRSEVDLSHHSRR